MFTTIRFVLESNAWAAKRWPAQWLACASAACLVGGCASEDTGATGTVVLRVGDSPYPFDMMTAAEITIDRVEVRVLGDDKAESGFYVLSEAPRTMNLLDLRSGVTEVLVESEIPIGELDQIRLHVARGGVTLADGRSLELDVPSGLRNGLKVTCNPSVDVLPDTTTELLLDFDLSESFEAQPAAPKKTADIEGFQFHPVVRVANLSETGTLSGHVRWDAGSPQSDDDAAIADAEVLVAGLGATYGTSTDAMGEWRILGLPPGAYVVTASTASHHAGKLTTTVVLASDVTGNDFVLAQAIGR